MFDGQLHDPLQRGLIITGTVQLAAQLGELMGPLHQINWLLNWPHAGLLARRPLARGGGRVVSSLLYHGVERGMWNRSRGISSSSSAGAELLGRVGVASMRVIHAG
jgi:hypothetical protein